MVGLFVDVYFVGAPRFVRTRHLTGRFGVHEVVL